MTAVNVSVQQGSEIATLVDGFTYLSPAVEWSPTDKSSLIDLTNSNKTATRNAAGARAGVGGQSSSAKTTGAWYAEFVCNVQNSVSWLIVGVSPPSALRNNDLGAASNCYGYPRNGRRYFDGSVGSAVYATWTTGDVIGLKIDIGANTIEFLKNNVTQGVDSVTLDAASYVLALSSEASGDQITIATNATDCTYALPAGFSYWSP